MALYGLLFAEIPDAVTAAIIAVVGTVVLGAMTYLTTRRANKQNRELGLIQASQDALIELIEQQRREIEQSRHKIERLQKQVDRIPKLEAQIRAMRGELAETLSHRTECESDRAQQADLITALRAQLAQYGGQA